MRTFLLSTFIILVSFFTIAQDYNPVVDELITNTSLDSLVKYTRELSGEDSVMVNGSMVLIQNRVFDQNDMAAEYIKQKLTEFGLEPVEQQYDVQGKNIYALKSGTLYPDEKYIICAHYDAVADYCADDNASGCAAVLESARLMSQMEFEYTIIFAFWDEEEIGILGSAYYAEQAAQNNEIINGVVNLEMFGWDSNDDMLFDIHTQNYANSNLLANMLVTIDDVYELLLEPDIHNPGTTASDHSSFWNQGYSAIVFSQAFFGGDGNPYYHTSMDRIEHFNLPYFHELSKLAVASISTLCEPISVSISQNEFNNEANAIRNFPNPFRNETNISVYNESAGDTKISVYDYFGREIEILHNDFLSEGNHSFIFSAYELSKGFYIVRLESQSSVRTTSMIVQ